MFKINNTPYDVRVTKLEQPMRMTTNYGLRTFSYIGSRLWNQLVQEYPEVPHMDLGQFKTFLKHWTGPKCYWNAYTPTCFLHEVIIYDLHTCIYLIVHFETCTVYICTPIYSRILACWLMLSVLQTTEN